MPSTARLTIRPKHPSPPAQDALLHPLGLGVECDRSGGLFVAAGLANLAGFAVGAKDHKGQPPPARRVQISGQCTDEIEGFSKAVVAASKELTVAIGGAPRQRAENL